MALFKWPWSRRKLNERLFDVAFEGDSEEVMALLKKGANPNIKNDAGVTTLIRTSLKGHTQVVRVLLDHGADVNARANNGSTALLATMINGHAATLRTLLDKNPDSVTVDARERRKGLTVLVWAAQDGHIDIVRWLLEAGANPNIPSNAGTTALIHAAAGGYTEMVTELLNHAAEPNAQTKKGLTALMAAVFNGHLKAVKALLDGGADVNARLNTGETSLMGAARDGYKQIIECLIERGAHLDAKDRKIALDLAREEGHTDVMQLLTSKGEPSSSCEIHQAAERQLAQQDNPFSEKIFNFLDENPLSIGTLDEFKRGREDFSNWGDGILTGSKEWVVNKLCIKLSEIGVNNPPSIRRSQNYEWQTSNLEGFTARIEASLPNMLAGYYIGRIGDNLYGLFGCNLNNNETENPAHLPQ